jgi:hypothetical protein
VASRTTADRVRFWDWPAHSAWLRSLGDWGSGHALLEGMWGAGFLFLYDVRLEKDMALFGAAVADCVSSGRRLLVFTRDDGLLERLPEDAAAALDGKALPVRIKD